MHPAKIQLAHPTEFFSVPDKEKVRVAIKDVDRIITRYHSSHPSRVELHLTHDPMSAMGGLRYALKLGPRNATGFLETFHANPGLGAFDMYHLVNTVSISLKPWIVTFEHYLPRWNAWSRWGIEKLTHVQCRRIVAMSEYALRSQKFVLRGFPQYAETILEKSVVLHPAQEALITPSQRPRRSSDKLRLAFVGSDFFRKGGREILLAFSDLIREKVPVHLTIVSTLDPGDYASGTTQEDAAWAREMIRQMGDNITYTPSMPNDQVLDLFRHSDVSLLPTYHDTYGFALLESQGAGCPVISTAGCALPEINDSDVGWMIRVPLDMHGDPCFRTAEQRAVLSRTIREGLYATIKEIARSPECAAAKGENALRRIIQKHDPATVRDAIESMCLDAVRGKPLLD